MRRTVSICTCDLCGDESETPAHVPPGWGSIIATVVGGGFGEQMNSGELVYCPDCLVSARVRYLFVELERRRAEAENEGSAS